MLKNVKHHRTSAFWTKQFIDSSQKMRDRPHRPWIMHYCC